MIENEIIKAEELYNLYCKGILQDKELSALIKEYRGAIEQTWKTMKSLNVTGTCSDCAAGDPGGCCFREVETWYSDIQLLINMLMGADIRMTRMYDNSCMFVGEKGCRLISRNAFCINFLCGKIKSRISIDKIDNLNFIAGKEITCGIELENALTKWLSNKRRM